MTPKIISQKIAIEIEANQSITKYAKQALYQNKILNSPNSGCNILIKVLAEIPIA